MLTMPPSEVRLLTLVSAPSSDDANTDIDIFRVLVIGGGGAGGFAAIQLAMPNGCQVVTTCDSQELIELRRLALSMSLTTQLSQQPAQRQLLKADQCLDCHKRSQLGIQ
ncbi:hypothetical protein NL676_024042 [Syzygium grande]|nr:hypothetical protein NL676_024042 [Syzygium grande]